MKIIGFICSDCGEIVYSRSRRDFRTCCCYNSNGNSGIFVDGGQDDYHRYGGKNIPDMIEFEIDKTKDDLFREYLMELQYPFKTKGI